VALPSFGRGGNFSHLHTNLRSAAHLQRMLQVTKMNTGGCLPHTTSPQEMQCRQLTQDTKLTLGGCTMRTLDVTAAWMQQNTTDTKPLARKTPLTAGPTLPLTDADTKTKI
jgi:hypothetical protein